MPRCLFYRIASRAFKKAEDLPGGDRRRIFPRFQGENFERNFGLTEKIQALAKRKGCTAAQLALAWVLAQGEDVVPIPGTKRRQYLEENAGSIIVELTASDLKEISPAAPIRAAAVLCYPEQAMQAVNR